MTENDHRILNQLLDEIIPAGKDNRPPGAGNPSLNVAEFHTNRLDDTPDIKELFERGMGFAQKMLEERGMETLSALDPEERLEFVHDLEVNKPEFFRVLIINTYKGYYSHPAIPPYFGFPEHPPHPKGCELQDDDPEILDALIEPVRSRGQFYRESKAHK